VLSGLALLYIIFILCFPRLLREGLAFRAL